MVGPESKDIKYQPGLEESLVRVGRGSIDVNMESN